MKCPFCHSERSEESDKLNMSQMRMHSYEFEILRLTPQNDIFRQVLSQVLVKKLFPNRDWYKRYCIHRNLKSEEMCHALKFSRHRFWFTF
jgi:hypothetical protein